MIVFDAYVVGASNPHQAAQLAVCIKIDRARLMDIGLDACGLIVSDPLVPAR